MHVIITSVLHQSFIDVGGYLGVNRFRRAFPKGISEGWPIVIYVSEGVLCFGRAHCCLDYQLHQQNCFPCYYWCCYSTILLVLLDI